MNLALKIETQLNRPITRSPNNFRRPTQEVPAIQKSATTTGSSEGSSKTTPPTQTAGQGRNTNVAPNRVVTQAQNQHPNRANNDPYARPNLGKCFKCNQTSHLLNNCPNRRSVNLVEEERMVEDAEEEQGFVDDTYEGAEYTEGDEGDAVASIVQRLLLAPKKIDDSQRHKIFRTRCTLNNKVCNVIIDNGSSKNVVSRALVKALNLKTEKRSSPYKIAWIKKGPEIRVMDVCKVPLSIGKYYKDKVTSDVVDMDASHVLLGRTWHFDVDATYKGRDNTYMFWWYDKKILLLPKKPEKGPKGVSNMAS